MKFLYVNLEWIIILNFQAAGVGLTAVGSTYTVGYTMVAVLVVAVPDAWVGLTPLVAITAGIWTAGTVVTGTTGVVVFVAVGLV